MPPSYKYRLYLRDIRMFLSPEHEALLGDKKINNLRMDDLEALYELVMGADPRRHAPNEYRCRRIPLC